ncbi:unnamed protein product [Arabis nemorensis]|uniref:Uncharacterized protein n=1 Tax=Arabis nemorensis TaxID=586526 RepID=A0A565CEM6_9BRAS|nr:unnamed protein product [Arabis nemorensis]
MSEKPLIPHADSPHAKQPYKALRMRARSPKPIGRKWRKTKVTKKTSYKALLIRAQSPETFQENSTDSEATSSKDLEVKPRKNSSAKGKSISNKKNSSKKTMSRELDVTQTARESHNNRGSKKNNSDEDIMSNESEAEFSKEEA